MEGALFTLLLLACPVGMGVMMWFMGKGMKGSGKEAGSDRPATVEELRSQQDRLGAQIERLEQPEASGNGELARR